MTRFIFRNPINRYFRLCTWIILSLGYNFKGKTGSLDSFPSISLIVPAFDEEITMKESIKSLTELDYPNYEIIIVDDGSTDKTLKLAREFESSNVKVIHQQNQGKANALNNGINNSIGEIVFTVDADIKLKEDSLKKISARFVKNKQVGAVVGNVKVIPEKSILNAF